MALVFPNVSVLGITQDSRFFDAGFQYSSFRKLSIGGLVIDLTETFGITGVWTGVEGVLPTIRNNQNYQPLILNGINFGSGRIQNITFSPGTDVRTKEYTADIIVFSSGNLFNFTGLYYSGIDTSQFQYLQQFSEDYSFEKKLNGGYSYSHDATIQFTSGVGQLNSISAAQALARTLFTGSNLGFAFYPGFTNKQGKRYITESYDLINNVCTFGETFDFNNNNGAYSAIYSTSIELNQDGILSATEDGLIQGIENPNWQNALSAIAVEMTGSYYRCSGAANYYFSGYNILVPTPISQGRAFDIFSNNISYSVSFNNAPDNYRTYYWNYNLQADKKDDITTVTEQGTVIGRGPNPTTSFTNAQNGFVVVSGGIPTRTTAVFQGAYSPSTNYLEQKQQSYSPIQGKIDYSYVYSNDPTLVSNNGIRRVQVKEDENKPVYSYNKINILNYAEIIQNDYQSTQGSNTIEISFESDRTVPLSTMVASGVAIINSRIPAGSDRYVGDASYSFDPNGGSAEVNLTWLYNRSASTSTFPS